MKNVGNSSVKVVLLENSEPISAETDVIERRIQQRAFELSHARPHDAHQRYDWIAAESEVISVPAMELIETEGKLELKFAAAGVSPGDVTLMVTPNQILLKSIYSHQHNSDVGTIHLCDFKSSTIFRSVTLPFAIDVKTLKARVAGGMVTVTASKAEQAGARRTAVRRTPA